ncbi:MAG: ABC transporter ATP-binding protein [Alphaproteobacteria bacterium]|nr:ABC transporter ATP-binding protein [Alphaproteobacteria bacterium]
MSEPLLAISDLSVEFATPRGKVKALRRVDLSVRPGRIVGIVGESGCGKSTLVSAVMGLLAGNAKVTTGAIAFEGRQLRDLTEEQWRDIRGRRLAMVFQDPMTSLNPVMSIATQMIDIQHRDPGTRADKLKKAIHWLGKVGIADPEQRIEDYPHRFSGGMRQRISIAMALLMNPSILIADEPTTALDVTLEAQIIHLIKQLRSEFDGAILFVSHNLGLIAEICDEVVVMYAGEVVEHADIRRLFHAPAHPYTQLLLTCDPARIDSEQRTLPTIGGTVPDLAHLPQGCIFAARCPSAFDRCRMQAPPTYTIAEQHHVRCFLHADG